MNHCQWIISADVWSVRLNTNASQYRWVMWHMWVCACVYMLAYVCHSATSAHMHKRTTRDTKQKQKGWNPLHVVAPSTISIARRKKKDLTWYLTWDPYFFDGPYWLYLVQQHEDHWINWAEFLAKLWNVKQSRCLLYANSIAESSLAAKQRQIPLFQHNNRKDSPFCQKIIRKSNMR